MKVFAECVGVIGGPMIKSAVIAFRSYNSVAQKYLVTALRKLIFHFAPIPVTAPNAFY